jgi:hypothetical protein
LNPVIGIDATTIYSFLWELANFFRTFGLGIALFWWVCYMLARFSEVEWPHLILASTAFVIMQWWQLLAIEYVTWLWLLIFLYVAGGYCAVKHAEQRDEKEKARGPWARK